MLQIFCKPAQSSIFASTLLYHRYINFSLRLAMMYFMCLVENSSYNKVLMLKYFADIPTKCHPRGSGKFPEVGDYGFHCRIDSCNTCWGCECRAEDCLVTSNKMNNPQTYDWTFLSISWQDHALWWAVRTGQGSPVWKIELVVCFFNTSFIAPHFLKNWSWLLTLFISYIADDSYCTDKPFVRGPCHHNLTRYSYKDGECRKVSISALSCPGETNTSQSFFCFQFIYSGCHGTWNNFPSLWSCKKTCGHCEWNFIKLFRPNGWHCFADSQTETNRQTGGDRGWARCPGDETSGAPRQRRRRTRRRCGALDCIWWNPEEMTIELFSVTTAYPSANNPPYGKVKTPNSIISRRPINFYPFLIFLSFLSRSVHGETLRGRSLRGLYPVLFLQQRRMPQGA